MGFEYKVKWQKLRHVDFASFLLIGLSYTVLDIAEMHQTEFDYLLGYVTTFLQIEALPPKWMFHKEIQLAVAAETEHLQATDFRRSMYSSTHSTNIPDTNRILLPRIQTMNLGSIETS